MVISVMVDGNFLQAIADILFNNRLNLHKVGGVQTATTFIATGENENLELLIY